MISDPQLIPVASQWIAEKQSLKTLYGQKWRNLRKNTTGTRNTQVKNRQEELLAVKD
jgi:hypothetical protein